MTIFDYARALDARHVVAVTVSAPRCACGAVATVCDDGPPVRWLCTVCQQVERVELRRAAQERVCITRRRS